MAGLGTPQLVTLFVMYFVGRRFEIRVCVIFVMAYRGFDSKYYEESKTCSHRCHKRGATPTLQLSPIHLSNPNTLLSQDEVLEQAREYSIWPCPRLSTHIVCRNGNWSMLSGSTGPYRALKDMLNKLRSGICMSRFQGTVPAIGPGVCPCAQMV